MSETQFAYNVRGAGDERKATGWCSYRGNVVGGIGEQITSGTPMGPNYMGELMWPVEATYDPDTGTTRVGFSLVAPAANDGSL